MGVAVTSSCPLKEGNGAHVDRENDFFHGVARELAVACFPDCNVARFNVDEENTLGARLQFGLAYHTEPDEKLLKEVQTGMDRKAIELDDAV